MAIQSGDCRRHGSEKSPYYRASSGIGQARRSVWRPEGMDLILVARRLDRLQALGRQLEKAHGVRVFPLAVDIRNGIDLQTKLLELGPEIDKVDVLINCAGLARGTAKMAVAEIADWDEMIDVNVKALLALTRWMLPRLLKHQHSHIVNLGSVAGRWVYPGGAVYCATKYAVRAISEGLAHGFDRDTGASDEYRARHGGDRIFGSSFA